MPVTACKKRGSCGMACGEGPCPLIAAWARRLKDKHRARVELGGLSERELKDIGLSRCQIESAVSGALWP